MRRRTPSERLDWEVWPHQPKHGGGSARPAEPQRFPAVGEDLVRLIASLARDWQIRSTDPAT
jgi:hypothetical protein